ncbi:MAG TPA: hypothetical protein VHP83_19755 [Aggregatilineaceae bacterium]|nr:hypothetical protein [Aggregatilineaceae bacterium]
MFIHVAIHQPYPEKADLLAASMERFGRAMMGKPGFQRVFVLRDQQTGSLLGLAMWDSVTDWHAARSAMIAAVQDDPIGEWELQVPEVYHLDVLWSSD